MTERKDKMAILKCDCDHEFQDKTYGKKRRVMNPTAKPDEFRCTVCRKERGGGSNYFSPKKGKKK